MWCACRGKVYISILSSIVQMPASLWNSCRAHIAFLLQFKSTRSASVAHLRASTFGCDCLFPFGPPPSPFARLAYAFPAASKHAHIAALVMLAADYHLLCSHSAWQLLLQECTHPLRQPRCTVQLQLGSS